MPTVSTAEVPGTLLGTSFWVEPVEELHQVTKKKHTLQCYHKRALDMRRHIANEACSAELAIIISYPTSASGIIVLLKNAPNK